MTPPSARRPVSLRLRALVLVALALALAPRGAHAAAAAPIAGTTGAGDLEIHLITIGVGEPVLTAGGHTALMVAKLKDGVPDPAGTLVYHFGDTDFDDPELPFRFLRGEAVFRLAIAGTLQEVVDTYGVQQARDIWRQRLQLTPTQAAEVADRLAAGVQPEHRDYRYHHADATCTTKIRDLLDEVTGGALRRDLVGRPAIAPTAREVQRELFRRHHLVAIGGDLIFGRMHDHPVDKYWALVHPPRMKEHLQEVQVPSPTGEGVVPFAEPPVALIEFLGPAAVTMPSIVTPLVSALAILGIVLGGLRARRRLPARRVGAGLTLILYPLISGLIGALLLAVVLYTEIPELKANENVLVFPATDLFLVVIGARWLRRPLGLGELWALRAYAYGRLALLGLIVALHGVGVLYQEPRIFVAMSLAFSLVLIALVRRAPSITCP